MENNEQQVESAVEELRDFVNRWENLLDQIKDRKDDQKVLMEEITNSGFDKKAFLRVIKIRRGEDNDDEAFEMLVETYKKALGIE